MADAAETCSRCEAPLDTDPAAGTARWCRACRAKYQREYQDLRRQMAAGKGFHAGAEAMRVAMLAKLGEMPGWAELQCREMLAWIGEFPAPRQ